MNRILSTRNALVLLTVFLTVRLLPVFADEIGVKEKELLTLEDIVAGYQYNASLFDSSRVIMLYKTQNLLAVKKLDSDDPMQDALEYTILNQEEVPVESGYIDYWGNMQKFLCCFIPLPDVSKLPLDTKYGFNADWILDAAPTYRDASFFSFSLISKQTRYWGGNCDREKLEKFHCTGAISAGPNQMPSGFVFPPFFSNSFGDIQLFHSIDSFFLLPKNELKFVGRTTLDGVPVVVLQHKKISMENFPFQGVAMMRVRTAWIDTQRGFIPLRIDENIFWMHNGEVLPCYPHDEEYVEVEGRDATDVITCTKIEKQEGGGFYPMLTQYDVWYQLREDTVATNNVDDICRNIKHCVENPRPRSKTRHNEWEILSVFPPKEITEDAVAFEFPKNTRVYDTINKKEYFAGLSQKEFDAHLWKQMGRQNAPDSGLTGIVPNPNKSAIDDFVPRLPEGYRRIFLLVGTILIIISILVRIFFTRKKNRHISHKKGGDNE